MSIHILANHAHVLPAAVNPNGTVVRLLKLLDACAIEEAICFAPFPQQLEAMGVEPNRWLATELRASSRLRGFGTLDLRRPDLRDQIRRIKDLGFFGLKMHPNAQEFDVLCPAAMIVYGLAQDEKLFITFHTGVHHYRLKHYNVKLFDEVAWNFKDLRFSLEHVGGYSFFNEALAVIVNNIPFPPVPGRRCMVYAGLTSIFTPNYCRFWYMPRERLDELVAQAGVEQLIFGLDFPYNLEEATKLGLQTIRALGLTAAEEAMILGGNLREALGLPAVLPVAQDVPAAVAPD